MRASLSISRGAVAGLIAVGLIATSGCSWFRKGDPLYAKSAESRPLEVPPDLDLPRTQGAMGAPAGSVTSSGQAAAGPVAMSSSATAIGFNVAGTRDAVFNKVGEALAGIEGVEIASRAQLLGAFDVSYDGSSFLVRVSAIEAGSYVSAVDPRGMPAPGEAPARVIAALKTALAGR